MCVRGYVGVYLLAHCWFQMAVVVHLNQQSQQRARLHASRPEELVCGVERSCKRLHNVHACPYLHVLPYGLNHDRQQIMAKCMLQREEC